MGKVKSSSLAYNQRETRDKQPLDRDLDRSWCHRNTSVKLSWSQPMNPWTEWQHTRMLLPNSMESWAVTKKKKKRYTSVEVTPAAVLITTQWPLVPSFMSVVGYARTFHLVLLHCIGINKYVSILS